jgi:two-component system alkaline phosphatase synthesis response regulator PhoP
MSRTPLKILLVDDEPDVLEFMSYSLKKEGYSVFTASNGKDALNIAKHFLAYTYQGRAQ